MSREVEVGNPETCLHFVGSTNSFSSLFLVLPMPTERIRFSEGVSRLHGTKLEAPYDLKNAELRRMQGVKALNGASRPNKDVPHTNPDGSQRPDRFKREIVRHGPLWREARATARRGEVMFVSEELGDLKITGDPTTSNDEGGGNTTIEISTGANDRVSLSSGDYVQFANHDTRYEVSSGDTIGSSSSGSITLSSGLSTSVPSGTRVFALYLSTQHPTLERFSEGATNGGSSLPQITAVETIEGGFKSKPRKDSRPTTWDEDRWVYYLLIPLNAKGEAGPYTYAGRRLGAQERLPELLISTNESVREIVAYKTALFEDGNVGNPDIGATSFWRMGRFSAGRGGLTQAVDSTQEYSAGPPRGQLFPPSEYRQKTGIDYIYPVAGHAGEGQWDWEQFDDFDPVGWELEFKNLVANGDEIVESGSVDAGGTGGLEVSVRYVVASTSTHPDTGNVRLHLEDQSGNALSFSGKDVLAAKDVFDGFDDRTFFYGAAYAWYPPSSTILEDGTIVIRDAKRWTFSGTQNGNQPWLPTGDTPARPQNVHTPSSVGATEDTNGRTKTTQSGIRTAAYDDLYYSGGLMWGAAPRWPLQKPQPCYIEEDTGAGKDVRLQFEYKVGERTVMGPPSIHTNVSKLACAWHGIERALHVFAKYPLSFSVNSITITGDEVTIFDPFSWYRNNLSSGDTLYLGEYDPFNEDLAKTGYEVSSVSTSGDDTIVTLTASVDHRPGDYARPSKEVYVESFGNEQITFTDTTGELREFMYGTMRDSFGNLVHLQRASYDSSNDEITFDAPDLDYDPGSKVDLLDGRLATFSSVNDEIVVDDPNDEIGSGGSAGDRIDVVESTNLDGDYTLQSDPSSDTPSSGETTLEVGGLRGTTADGKVQWGSGTWSLGHRLTPPKTGGAYLRDQSTIIFDIDALSVDDFRYSDLKGREHAPYVTEQDSVFFSNTNRPMEMTVDQIETPEGSVVRGLFRARLAEEEGLRAYDFYVATEGAIYVANPDPVEREATLQAVTSSYGVTLDPLGKLAKTLLPSGAVVVGTDGHIHVLSGRREDRLFPTGFVPWSEVRDLTYSSGAEMIFISTDTGVWGYDTDREAITHQRDLDATSILFDDRRGEVLTYDQSAKEWAVLDGSGSLLNAKVQTQPMGHGGGVWQVKDLEVDYDTSGYDPTDASTYATITETRRRGNESPSFDAPRTYHVDPPLKGQGLQLEVEGFETLREMRFERAPLS